jgi:hypothetical protein
MKTGLAAKPRVAISVWAQGSSTMFVQRWAVLQLGAMRSSVDPRRPNLRPRVRPDRLRSQGTARSLGQPSLERN